MNTCGVLLTVREAAERLRVREGTVRAWLAQRRIPKVKLGRATRIPSEAIDQMIAEGLVPSRQQARRFS